MRAATRVHSLKRRSRQGRQSMWVKSGGRKRQMMDVMTAEQTGRLVCSLPDGGWARGPSLTAHRVVGWPGCSTGNKVLE